jgi:hypothetical protein
MDFSRLREFDIRVLSRSVCKVMISLAPDATISARIADNYINGAPLIRSFGKRWKNYMRAQGANREFAGVLEAALGVHVFKITRGNRHQPGAVFCHPILILHMVCWAKPRIKAWLFETISRVVYGDVHLAADIVSFCDTRDDTRSLVTVTTVSADRQHELPGLHRLAADMTAKCEELQRQNQVLSRQLQLHKRSMGLLKRRSTDLLVGLLNNQDTLTPCSTARGHLWLRPAVHGFLNTVAYCLAKGRQLATVNPLALDNPRTALRAIGQIFVAKNVVSAYNRSSLTLTNQISVYGFICRLVRLRDDLDCSTNMPLRCLYLYSRNFYRYFVRKFGIISTPNLAADLRTFFGIEALRAPVQVLDALAVVREPA